MTDYLKNTLTSAESTVCDSLEGIVGYSDQDVTLVGAWSLGTIPTQGLTIAANVIASATPFSGFTEATARVNIKGCVGAAGLLAETPIVP